MAGRRRRERARPDHVSRYFYAWTGQHRWVDKNNQNGLCVPYLHALFPDAVFVYVKRSPGDNLHSLIEGWGKPDEFATWSSQLPAKVAVDGGRYRQWCFFLAPGGVIYVEAPIEDVAAFQYESINRAILDARDAIPPGNGSSCSTRTSCAIPSEPSAGCSRAAVSPSMRGSNGIAARCWRLRSTPFPPFALTSGATAQSRANRARVAEGGRRSRRAWAMS